MKFGFRFKSLNTQSFYLIMQIDKSNLVNEIYQDTLMTKNDTYSIIYMHEYDRCLIN